MNCPACKSSMIICELNQVEIDYCLTCKGIWLDSGELELIFSDGNGKNTEQYFIHKSGYTEDKRRCPVCKKKMEKVEFEKSGIVLDKCYSHGLWFDSGELKALLNTSAELNNKMIDLLKEMFGE